MRFAISAVTLCCAAMMLPVPQAQALITEKFTFTGGEQTFTVPAGVHKVRLGAEGGEGGKTPDALGGSSVGVTGPASVNPGQTLFIEVGGDGQSQAEGGAGDFNGPLPARKIGCMQAQRPANSVARALFHRQC